MALDISTFLDILESILVYCDGFWPIIGVLQNAARTMEVAVECAKSARPPRHAARALFFNLSASGDSA